MNPMLDPLERKDIRFSPRSPPEDLRVYATWTSNKAETNNQHSDVMLHCKAGLRVLRHELARASLWAISIQLDRISRPSPSDPLGQRERVASVWVRLYRWDATAPHYLLDMFGRDWIEHTEVGPVIDAIEAALAQAQVESA